MNAARWPTQREDGSVSVAVQFACSGPGVADDVRSAVESYIDRKSRVDRVSLLVDLFELPFIDTSVSAAVRVRFDARPGSRMWKDWMVECTSSIANTVEGIKFEGFYDAVSGTLRPSSTALGPAS